MGPFRPHRTACIAGVLLTLGSSPAVAQDATHPDLMNFAQGTLPIGVVQGEEAYRVGPEHAIAAIDGNSDGFVALRKPAPADGVVEFLYALPALTRFDSFAVPNVTETPSPSQTFFKTVSVSGSAEGPDGPFLPLASAELATHDAAGQVTPLTLSAEQPKVQWVRLRLQGGIDVQVDKTFFEFSELIGTGTQDPAELSDRFDGVWSGRGVKLELKQDGATVSGCYDGNARLTGTVDGSVLRAIGANDAGIPSQFVLIAGADGAMRGLRSTNGAPFKPYNGDASGKPPKCLAPEAPKLGCGSVVHGIRFDFDSAAIRPSSQTLLADLYEGLAQSGASQITIVGHSSSEGAEDYNRDLSERRAQSVVAALAGLGLDAGSMSAAGRGEDEPIASNDDEAGRSLNRRVEIQCSG